MYVYRYILKKRRETDQPRYQGGGLVDRQRAWICAQHVQTVLDCARHDMC